jgi:hypothetical protein
MDQRMAGSPAIELCKLEKSEKKFGSEFQVNVCKFSSFVSCCVSFDPIEFLQIDIVVTRAWESNLISFLYFHHFTMQQWRPPTHFNVKINV